MFENYIQVVVKDNGVGIEKDAINRIFDRFYTRDNFHAQRTEGTGIGLALTKSLVELHMGSIWVESEKGNGSLIYFKIPIILKPFNTQNSNIIFDRDEPVEHSPKQVKIEPPDNGVKKTQQLIAENDDSTIVLIVEDNPDLLEFIKSNLNSSYRFLEASNGHEGYELAIKSVPDIIVSDVMMPVMDGIEFSSKIKTNVITSHIPIILLTAKATKEHKIEGFKTGADDYITKPFDPEILNLRIENLLQTRAKLKEVFSKEITLEPTQTKITSHDEKLIQRLLDALEKNLENVDFGVSELVKVSGMSRPVLYRKVKALTGLTVVQFINIYKLKKAAHFLSQKKISVSEVAYAVGFNDPKYFSKCFTKHYGLTPKEYAAQIPD